MADLVGIQIKDLSTAGAINGTTELPVQRTGVNKAEKINLTNFAFYFYYQIKDEVFYFLFFILYFLKKN